MLRRLFTYYVLTFYVLTIAYPVIRIWMWYEPTTEWNAYLATIAMMCLVVLPFALLMMRFLFGVSFPKRTMTWLYSIGGVCFLLFPVVLAIEVIRWLPFFPRGHESLIAVVSIALLGIYSHVNARVVRVKRVPVGNAPNLAGKSIVQLSDVHIGSRTTKFLEGVVQKVKALNPTWVVITGDLVDARHVGEEELKPLREIANRSYFVTGNHERYEGVDRLTTILESLGVRVLRNQSDISDQVQFVGVDDHDSPDFLKSQLQRIKLEDDLYHVLLYHRPHGVELALDWGFQLMLVGHTHKGQLFPFRLVVRRFFQKTHGTHRFKDMILHISTGTGTWGPTMRLGSSNEITHLVFD